MRDIALSALAWEIELEPEVIKILKSTGLKKVDLVPAKYFTDRLKVTKDEILKVKKYWKDQGFDVLGFQSLFFKEEPMNLFGPKEVQDSILSLLERLAYIGSVLEAPYFVFGSPKNRNRSDLTDEETMDTAKNFFFKLGELVKRHGAIFCLEPNPPVYGANFLTTTEEAGLFVREVNHPNIKMQLDTGTMEINKEDPLKLIQEFHKEVGHIHLSTDQIRPLTEDNCRYALYKKALDKYLPEKAISIEILPKDPETKLEDIERSIGIAKKWFSRASESF